MFHIHKIAKFNLQDQREIIHFLNLRSKTPIKIHRQLSDTWSPMKALWTLKMDIHGCKSLKKVKDHVIINRSNLNHEPAERAMITHVEQVVMEDCHLGVHGIAFTVWQLQLIYTKMF